MKGMFKTETAGAVNYLKEVEKAGKNFKLKPFSNISPKAKKQIVLEAYTKQLSRLMDYQPNVFSSKLNDDGIIEVSRTITVIATCADNSTHKITVELGFLTIVPRFLSEDAALYSFELKEHEVNEQVILSRAKYDFEVYKKFRRISNFDNYRLEIADKDKRFLTEISVSSVKKLFPKKLFYNNDFSLLLRDFIDVLCNHQLIEGKEEGENIVEMSRIYHAAINKYPLFKELSKQHQMAILNRAYIKAHEHSIDDIGLLAQYTFKLLVKCNLHNVVKIGDVVYTKVEEYPKCITYKDTKLGFTTSFSMVDLWSMIVS